MTRTRRATTANLAKHVTHSLSLTSTGSRGMFCERVKTKVQNHTYQYGLVIFLQRSFHLLLGVQSVALPPQLAGLMRDREPLGQQVAEDHIDPVTLDVGHPGAVSALLAHHRCLPLSRLPLQTRFAEAVSTRQGHRLEQKAQTYLAGEVCVAPACSAHPGASSCRRIPWFLSPLHALVSPVTLRLSPDIVRQVLYEVGQLSRSQSFYLRGPPVHIESFGKFAPEGERVSPPHHQLQPAPRVS